MSTARRPAALQFAETLRTATAAVHANRLRSVLTALGVVIGVASVILIVTLVQGFADTMTAQFRGLGVNSIVVYPMPTLKEQLQGKMPRLTLDDLDALRHEVPNVESVSPLLVLGQLGTEVASNGRVADTTVYGATHTFTEDGQVYPARGRFIMPFDDRYHRRICVLGRSLARKLQIRDATASHFVVLAGESFRVVGILNERGNIAGYDQDNQMIIPFGTAQSLLGGDNAGNMQFRLNIGSKESVDITRIRIEQVLRRRRTHERGGEDDFKVQTASQLADSMDSLFDGVSALLGGMVSIALVVAGIGIMNVMLVSVTERTKEIGICMSLGATARDILMQFLIEAMLISLGGGVLGVVLGIGLAYAIALFVPVVTIGSIPAWPVALSLVVSTAVGGVFGVVPATRAASLDPIVALRYE